VAGPEAGLGDLATVVDRLAAQDPATTGWSDAARAERVLALRRLLDRLEGHWLSELADLDARGAAGADQDSQAPRPPAGCGLGCGWGLGRPPAPCGRPGPCSAAPWRPPATR
jgi:hypothetical protein